MPVITYDMPIIDRKSRLAMFGFAAYVVLAWGIAYMATWRSGGVLSGAQLAAIPIVMFVPLANALYTVRQLDKLEKRSLLSQPAADQLFKAALTQLAVGYAMAVFVLPAFL